MVSTMPVNMTGRLQSASEYSAVICRRTIQEQGEHYSLMLADRAMV